MPFNVHVHFEPNKDLNNKNKNKKYYNDFTSIKYQVPDPKVTLFRREQIQLGKYILIIIYFFLKSQ